MITLDQIAKTGTAVFTGAEIEIVSLIYENLKSSFKREGRKVNITGFAMTSFKTACVRFIEGDELWDVSVEVTPTRDVITVEFAKIQ